jgi:hypothetical protein
MAGMSGGSDAWLTTRAQRLASGLVSVKVSSPQSLSGALSSGSLGPLGLMNARGTPDAPPHRQGNRKRRGQAARPPDGTNKFRARGTRTSA